MPSPEMQAFFSWFQSHDGYIDTAAMDVVDFPASEGGRGAIALVDIPENHTVFSIPRTLLLTPRTSALPAKMGERAWKKTFGLHRGWAGLILCMMWEAAQGAQSKWSSYFEMMPTTFDTPMFWSEDELAELKGTSVVDKLGKDDAEKTYAEKVLPAIQSRPDLFAQEDIPKLYSLDVFHMMGTRIQSRSFTVEKDESELVVAEQDQDVGNTSMGSAMDVDEPEATGHEHEDGAVDEHNEEGQGEGEEEDEDEDDEDDDDNTEIAMVPLADILNARYKSENVRLFYEPECLKMVSTRVIKAGEQIWNTYGDPPNAELLRAYGHVDWLPLPFTSKSESGNVQEQEYGNPGDVLEIRADLVVQCVLDELNGNANVGAGNSPMTMDDMEPRIDCWMEDVGEDVFVLEHPLADTDASPSSTPDPKQRLVQTLTPSLLAFIRLLSLPAADFARAQQKDKMPKPGVDARALRVARAVLVRRAGMYVGGGVVEDKAALGALDAVPVPVAGVRRRHAIMVRLGEKRVLEALLGVVDEAAGWVEKEEGAGAKDEKKNKRKAAKDDDAEGGRKKRR